MQLQHLEFTALLTDGGLHPCKTLAHVVVAIKAVALTENSICASADILAEQTWKELMTSLASNNGGRVSLVDLARINPEPWATVIKPDPNDNEAGMVYPTQEAVDTEQAARLKAAVEAKEGK